MSFVLALLVALGTWFAIQGEIWDRSVQSFNETSTYLKVYAPVERNQRCRRVGDAPVFRDLNPPAQE